MKDASRDGERLTTFGPYRLEKRIGQGGMGKVYRARHRELDRLSALKILPKSFAAEERTRKRFFHEIRTMARLAHPNLITIYDGGEERGLPYFAMELLHGPNLRDWMDTHGRATPAETFWLGAQILNALEALHGEGILHRDLKPSNVCVEPDGRVVVLDYGLALDDRLTRLTGSLELVGTGRYLPPESLRGARPTPAWDLHLWGELVWELLAGRFLWDGDSPPEVFRAKLERTAAPLPPELAVPPDLAAVVARCLEADPAARFADVPTLRVALVEALGTLDLHPGRFCPTPSPVYLSAIHPCPAPHRDGDAPSSPAPHRDGDAPSTKGMPRSDAAVPPTAGNTAPVSTRPRSRGTRIVAALAGLLAGLVILVAALRPTSPPGVRLVHAGLHEARFSLRATPDTELVWILFSEGRRLDGGRSRTDDEGKASLALRGLAAGNAYRLVVQTGHDAGRELPFETVSLRVLEGLRVRRGPDFLECSLRISPPLGCTFSAVYHDPAAPWSIRRSAPTSDVPRVLLPGMPRRKGLPRRTRIDVTVEDETVQSWEGVLSPPTVLRSFEDLDSIPRMEMHRSHAIVSDQLVGGDRAGWIQAVSLETIGDVTGRRPPLAWAFSPRAEVEDRDAEAGRAQIATGAWRDKVIAVVSGAPLRLFCLDPRARSRSFAKIRGAPTAESLPGAFPETSRSSRRLLSPEGSMPLVPAAGEWSLELGGKGMATTAVLVQGDTAFFGIETQEGCRIFRVDLEGRRPAGCDVAGMVPRGEIWAMANEILLPLRRIGHRSQGVLSGWEASDLSPRFRLAVRNDDPLASPLVSARGDRFFFCDGRQAWALARLDRSTGLRRPRPEAGEWESTRNYWAMALLHRDGLLWMVQVAPREGFFSKKANLNLICVDDSDPAKILSTEPIPQFTMDGAGNLHAYRLGRREGRIWVQVGRGLYGVGEATGMLEDHVPIPYRPDRAPSFHDGDVFLAASDLRLVRIALFP